MPPAPASAERRASPPRLSPPPLRLRRQNRAGRRQQAGRDRQPPHYDKGFVLVSHAGLGAALPYLLKLNHVSQFKYTNTLAVHTTYVTHLGEEKDVNRRNDFQLTRDVFYFSGYVFDKRLDFNILLYTSTPT